MGVLSTNKQYGEFLANLKQRVHQSRYQAARQVNKELILLYHHIGSEILRQQKEYGWGAKIIEQLSKDLKFEFTEIKGFSSRNLKYMRKFAEEYQDLAIVQQSVALLPWGHNVLLMEKITVSQHRMFYVEEAIKYGWSRSTLNMHIENKLHESQGKAISNFKTKLSKLQSDLANATLKDPYTFDFLNISPEAHEREIEKTLVRHIEKFLLELGGGFAFVGRQYHLKICNRDYYIDLLFYHLKLRAFVVIELKDKEFKPEYAGKINFYLSIVDDVLKHENDNPSIGLILCKTKDNVLAEYALRDMTKPIGLAEYCLDKAIPEHIKTELPSIEELEAELSKDFNITE